MAKNGSKQVYDDTYLHNLLFYTQICAIGQQVVLKYPMVSPKVNTNTRDPIELPYGPP